MKKSLRTSYKKYKSDSKEPVMKPLYLKIAAGYNKFLMEKVLEGDKVVFPSRLGTLQVVGRKPKIRFDEDGKVVGLAPNFKATKDLWNSNPKAKEEKKIVYHTNAHTDGYRFKYLWSKARVNVGNKTLYALRMTKGNKRDVVAKIKSGFQYVTK